MFINKRMKTVKKLFRANRTEKDLRLIRKIYALLTLPVFLVQMTSFNLFLLAPTKVLAEETTVAVEAAPTHAPAQEEKKADAPTVSTPKEQPAAENVAPEVKTPEVTAPALNEEPKIAPTETPVVPTEPTIDPQAASIEVSDTTPATPEASVAEPAAPQTNVAASAAQQAKELWSTEKSKATTNEAVELGKTYIAPQNDQVSVTFTKLPKDAGKLSIEEITLTDKQVALLGALSNKAYDITSTMNNGTFEYDLVLPKPKNQQDVQIKYSENVAGLENADAVPSNDVNVKDNNVSTTLDHFTFFYLAHGPAKADLIVTKTNDTANGNVLASGTFNWILTITNTGNKAATFSNHQVVLQDNMPSNGVDDYESAVISTSDGIFGNLDCNQTGANNRDLICKADRFLTIPAGGSIEISVPVHPNFSAVGSTLTNPRSNSGYHDSAICKVDPSDVISESNDDNNTCTNSIRVVRPSTIQLSVRNSVWGREGSLLADWQLNLFAGSDCAGDPLTQDVTNDHGQLSFENLLAGNYSVSETLPEGWLNTTPVCLNVNLRPGERSERFFVNFQLGSISGQKFNDQNGNGIKDEGENGLAAWTIYLDSNNNGVLDEDEVSTTTDADGNYTFAGLTHGTYTVREQQQEGWDQTLPTENSYPVHINSGTFSESNDFGNHDSAAPAITINEGADTIEVHTSFTDSGATWTDNFDGSGTIEAATSGSVDTDTIGDYTLSYEYTDGAGNTASADRIVRVVDTTKPVITLLGDENTKIHRGETYEDAGATAFDNYDGDLTAKIVVTSTVDRRHTGDYTVTYSVTDAAGNVSDQVVRNVNVHKQHPGNGDNDNGKSRAKAKNLPTNLFGTGNGNNPLLTGAGNGQENVAGAATANEDNGAVLGENTDKNAENVLPVNTWKYGILLLIAALSAGGYLFWKKRHSNPTV